MMPNPLVTIIINNFNYGRYLADAIESALRQTYPWIEVIVVDDGSTDNSRPVIAGYGDRVTAVLKENGGQASAFNAGLARAQGDVLIFLDADDQLHPHIVEQIVAVFVANPNVVRVQYRLELIDAAGVPMGELKPPPHVAMPNGDLRQQVLLFGDDIQWLPTSGNAFSMEMLQKIFPVPESPYRICADFYLSNLSPLFGLVVSIAEAGGYYRVHGSNGHHNGRLDLRRTRHIISRTDRTHGYICQAAHKLGLSGFSAHNVAIHSTTFMANRLVSLRLEPADHPISGDTRFSLAQRGITAALNRPDLTRVLRVMYVIWFLLAAIAPKSIVRWLALELFYPDRQRSLSNLVLGRFSTLKLARCDQYGEIEWQQSPL